jgi:endonuclease YncB( thermonuclease family)
MKCALIALLLVASPVPAIAETVSGEADVLDGDTLVIEGRHVRLFGIDAPETAQTCLRDGEAWACGEESARQLTQLIGTQTVSCTGNEIDQYSRLLAVCHAGRFELNRALVEHGWATAYHTYSDAYAADEARAKMNRLGIWGSTFDLPQTYRLARQAKPETRQQASQASAATTPPGQCVIKGNRSRRGDWIYHLPGMPYYDATRAEEMFCSEADARAAGYRRAIVR